MKKSRTVKALSILFALFLIMIFKTDSHARYEFPGIDDTPVIRQSFSFKCGKNVTWKYDYKTETVTISGKGDMYDESWEFVTGNENKYKSNRKTVKTVIVEEGVTSISKYAFNEFRSLKKVVLDNSVVTINDAAFDTCTSLKNVKLSEKTVFIGNYAFNCCVELENIVIPDSVQTIGELCFSECKIKGDLKLPSNLKNLGYGAFMMCNDLEKIIIPAGVTEIFAETFPDFVKIVVYNMNCVIHGGKYSEISGYAGSTAYEYAVKNKIRFSELGEHVHRYTSKVTRKATCAKKGVRTFTCTCGESYTKSIAKIDDHTYKNKKTKATPSKDGKIEKACTVCGDLKSTKTIYKVSTIKLSKSSYTYDGKIKTPEVVVKDSKGKILNKDMDYTLKYSSGRKNVGTYEVKVTFMDDYSGSKTLSFEIVLGKVSGVTVKKSKDVVQFTWSKVKGATGYIVYGCNESKDKFEKVGSCKTNLIEMNSVQNLEKYRVRAYYKDKNGNTHYGAYSDTIMLLK